MIPPLSTGQAQGGNILIVDDVDANLKLLANLLTHAGYHVRPAGSAALALRSVQAQPPDLVLLDVRMPDIDGYELCRRLKADKRTSAIPVIFISASVGVEERAEGFEAGAVDFVSKPFHEAEVLARVSTHLALYHARQELERKNTQLLTEAAERKQAQEAVQDERQRLAGIIEGTNVGTWEWNVQTGETVFNDRWARIIGYTLDEIAPVSIDTWMRYAHPDDLTASDELLQKHFRGELDYYEFESRMRHKNGSWVWVLDRGKVTSWTADGKPLLMMGTHQDITQRRQAEENLREQAQNYATLADSGRALVWTAGTDKLCNYFNRVWLEFTGRSLEQELGNGWAEGVHPDDLQRCLDIYIGAFDRRDAFSMEYRLRRHDGEYRWILDDGSPRHNAKGEFIGYIGHCLDITDRKRAEEAIQRERLFVDAVFESIPGILYVYDDQSKLVRWNKRHETVTGYSAEELSRMTSPDWHPEEERAEVARAVEAIMVTGFGTVEAHLLTRDGRNPLMQMNGVRLDLDGKTYFVGIGLDITERKQAEEALAASRAALVEAQAIGHIGNWSMNATDRRFFWSEEMYTIHGLKSGIPVSHETYVEVIHPEDRTRVFGVMELAMGGRQQEFSVDYRVVRTDRSVRFVTLTGRTVLDERNVVTGLHGTTQDITDRKRAQAALQESGARYRMLFDNMTTGFALHEMLYDECGKPVDYRFLEANQAFERLTGMPVASILGHTVLEVMPETEPRWIEAYARIVQTGTPALFEEYSGAIGKWFETRAFRVAENQFATIFADITERKRAEEELRESENRFRAVFDQAAVGVALLNTKTGQFVRINQKYCDFLGYTMEEMLQKTVVDVTLADDVQTNLDGIAQLMDGSSSVFSYEKRYVRKDGSLAWGSLAISPLWKPGEKPATYLHIAVVEDITDRKHAEAEKEAMQAQLLQSKKLEAVGQLAGGVAHNFNNLLTGVLGNIDIARSDLDPLHPAASSLDTARTAALRAAGLARQLSSFGRNALVLPVVQNANSAVLAALELVCSSLPASIGVTRDLAPDAWDVEVDPSQLTQVLLDLANNAREAMDDKGAITVRTRNITVDDAYVASHPFARKGEFVSISVADTGPGIDPSVLPRLFEPFATTKSFGRGMGLATTFGALKQAGGWATADSEPGAGARIDLYLPRHTNGPSPSA